MSPVDWRERQVWKLVSPNKTATRQMPDDRLKMVGKMMRDQSVPLRCWIIMYVS